MWGSPTYIINVLFVTLLCVHSLIEIRSVRLSWNILLTTFKVLPALLGGYVFLNTKGSRIVRILLCLKYDLQPELGSELPSRWWLRPKLPRSRVTKKENTGWRPSQKGVGKNNNNTLLHGSVGLGLHLPGSPEPNSGSRSFYYDIVHHKFLSIVVPRI